MRKFESILGYAIIGAFCSVALSFIVLYLPVDIAISLAIVIVGGIVLIGFGLTVVFHIKRSRQSMGDKSSRSQLDQGKSQ